MTFLFCYLLQKRDVHDYRQKEAMKKVDYEPVLVRDNKYNVIGEVVRSVRNKSLDALIFRIYDEKAASHALHRVVTLGDISNYGYIDFENQEELNMLKRLNVIGSSVGAISGVSYFAFKDLC